MTSVRSYLRTRLEKPMVRPLALAGPILVLLVALPLLRPLRHPTEMSNDELLRLSTVQALVEHRSLDLGHRLPAHYDDGTVRRGERLYSAQPPMMALLLSLPAWVMARGGLSLQGNFVPYLLTVLGTTLPVAVAAGLVYRMGRLFELRRHWRAGLGIAVVFGSGLISYAVVLNPHAPAAALVLASASCLIYVAALERARRRWLWFFFAGMSAALAATLDPPAAVLLLLFMFVIPAMRFALGHRAFGVVLYLAGAAVPILIHTHWNHPITGDWLPASLHAELAPDRGPIPQQARFQFFEDDEDPRARSIFLTVARPLGWLGQALFGGHGILSHFPIVIMGVAGVFAVMHRHWPSSTKLLAAATLVGAVTIILLYYIFQADWRDAMFASRWFIVFLPMLMFWFGAWIRRSHKPGTWVFASVLLGFSVVVSLLGATKPYPLHGFEGYTAAEAAKGLFSPQPLAAPEDALVETDPSGR